MRRAVLLVLCALFCTDASALAATAPGQLVFLVRDGVTVQEDRAGDTLTLTPALGLSNRTQAAQSGALTVKSGGGHTVIRLRPGVTTHSSRSGGRLVVAIGAPEPGADHAPAAPVAAATAPAPTTGVLSGLPAPLIAVVDAPGPVPPVAHATVPPARGAADLVAGTSPVSIEAALVPAASRDAAGLLLPFDPSVGAAAFQRGGHFEVVFDSRKPIDLSASVADPVFQQARLTLMPNGTLLDMPADPARPVSLRRVPEGWLIDRGEHVIKPVTPEPMADGLDFPVAEAGQVLTLADPAGGGDLLVGTVRSDSRAMTATGRTPGYQLVPSQLGVVIERLSDRVELRPHATGFRLLDPFAPSGGYRPDIAAAFSRAVALAPVGRAEQWRRFKLALATSASLPAAARSAARLDAARAALALGFGADARQLAEIADQDAPGAPDRGARAFLIGAGALMRGDADAARLLADPAIGNSDEATLWRGLAVLRDAPTDRPALRSVAALWPLLRSYPAPMQHQVLGDAALVLARNGDDAARALVTRLPDPGGKAALARALVGEATDHGAASLAALDRLFNDPDPDVSLSAALEAIDLRLRNGAIDTREAAKRTGKLIFDGRMAGRESEVAVRTARLRAQLGDLVGAMAVLREQAAVPGEVSPEIRRAAGDVLSQASEAGANKTRTDALSAVSLLEANQDLLPPEVDRVALTTRLAERLGAQNLPGRATGFLQQAFDRSAPGTDKATLGLALAETRLQADDPKGASATLASVPADGLSPAASERRALLLARIAQARGDPASAMAALTDLKSPAALSLKASMLGDSKDWQGEAAALSDLLSTRRPNGPDGRTLDEQDEALVLRLAGALSRAGRIDDVRALDRTWSAAFPDRSRRDMMALLAAPDVDSAGDLQRSASDLAAARSALKGLGGGAG